MRYAIIALSLLFGAATPAAAGAGVGISISGVSIGIHVPAYPELVPVPGYPVYYAPQLRANYFFYDGYYWLYHDDRWYVSDWYNGPWDIVEPDDVPLFVLRVPVRYYAAPPVYFHAWYVDAPPLWHVHWGHRWTRHHHGWERWDHRVAYAPAPLPHYQRHYAGRHYPRGEHRRLIRREHYHYRPHDIAVRRHDQQRQAARAQSRPAPQGRADFPRAQAAPRQSDEARWPAQAVPQQRAPALREPQRQPRQTQPPSSRHGQAFSQPRPQVQRAQPARVQRAHQAPRQREAVPRPPAGAAPQQHNAAARVERPAYRQAAEPRAWTQSRPQVRERAAPARPEPRQIRAAPERRQAMQARAQERGQRRQ